MGAATVSEAYEISAHVRDMTELTMPPGHSRFIVSGNIRPFRCTWRDSPVQYLKHRYTRPVVNLLEIPVKRKNQAQTPKTIVSGMAKRPVAFFDEEGDYLSGKSTVLLLNPRSGLDMHVLTVLLNSKIAALLYLALYGGLALAGGYLRFGPPQLAAFPVPKGLSTIQSGALSVDEIESLICSAYGLKQADVAIAFRGAFKELDSSISDSPEASEVFDD